MLQYTKITTSKLNWQETHTILPTFLGSTQEAHMGATCVLPSVASLTGRAVPLQSFKTLISNPIINEILVHKNTAQWLV